MPIIARDASARNERGGHARPTRRRSARPSSARAPGERGALPGRGWRTRPDEGFRARESLVAAPEPPLLSGRSKGADGGSDGTKPNGAAKPLAVLGPPFLRVARAWRPAEIFGTFWNILEILGTPWNFLGTFFCLPGLMGFLGISRVCARGESILPPPLRPSLGSCGFCGPAALVALERGRMATRTNQSRRPRRSPRRPLRR